MTVPPPERDSGTTLPSHLRRGELNRLAVLLRHATGGAWAIALYNTVAVRDDVMAALRRRLSPLPVHDFTFTPERTNPLAYLEQLPKEGYEKRAIIFLYDLTRAGKRVWGYLEMQREALAEHPHGLVFWLTPEERGEAVRSAPNFWSQRSGVFNFTIADEATLAQVRGQWAGSAVRFADRADWERQVRLYQGLLDEYQQSGSPPADTMFDMYGKLAYLYFATSDYRRTGELAKRQLALAKEIDDPRRHAQALNNIGLVYDNLGERRRALEYYEQALPIRREVGDRSGEATTLNNIGAVYDNLGERRRALEYYEQALPIRREVGDRSGEATTLNNIGAVYANLGERRRALEYYEQALPISREVGDRTGESVTLYNMAMVYEKEEHYAEATRLLEQVVAIDEAIEHPDLESDRAKLEQVRQRAAGH